MDIIAERIKAVRETKRIKQSEVAAALGIDSSNYAKLEKRGRKLTLEQLEGIANALEINLIDLLDSEYHPIQSEREKGLEQQVLELDQENVELQRTIKAFTRMSETIQEQYENIKSFDNNLKQLAQYISANFDDPLIKERIVLFFQMFLNYPNK